MKEKIHYWLTYIQNTVGMDRVTHFAVCYVLCDILYRWIHLPGFLVFCIVMLIGLLKEKTDDKFDTGDLLADFLGAFIYFL